jgi:hypothetical protein
LVGEAILQASVAELVDRSDGAQDIAFAGVLKKAHKADWGVSAPGKLSKREGCCPGLGVSESAHKAEHEPGHEPGDEPVIEPGKEPDNESCHEPSCEPGDESGQKTEGLVTLPGSAGGEGTRVARCWAGEPGHEPGHDPPSEPGCEPGYEPAPESDDELGDEPGPESDHKPGPERRAVKQLPPLQGAYPLGGLTPGPGNEPD